MAVLLLPMLLPSLPLLPLLPPLSLPLLLDCSRLLPLLLDCSRLLPLLPTAPAGGWRRW